jgi:gliding motility-associated-like protein
MKKITLLIIIFLLSFCGYAQLAQECFEGSWTPQVATPDSQDADWLKTDNSIGTTYSWAQQANTVTLNSFEGTPGTYAAYIDRENVPSGIPADYLITPKFNLPAGAQLRFQSKLNISGDNGSIFKIMILPEGGDPGDLTAYEPVEDWTEPELALSPLPVYEEKIVTFNPVYEGTNVRIAFVMEGDNGDRWLIDCVIVTGFCDEPANLVSNNIGMNGAELSWDNPGNAASWEIEIIPEGTDPTGHGVVYNGTFPYMAAQTATGNPLVQTPLFPDTGYKYYVRSLCDDGGQSNWKGAHFFKTLGLGDDCSVPLEITVLPYSDTDTTANFANAYIGYPGYGCSNMPWEDYLSGNDVVYRFIPSFTGTVSVDLTNNDYQSGVFVYEECDDIGLECFAGGTAGFAGSPVELEFEVTNGEDYYLVVSSYYYPTVDYTITIQQVFCDEPEGLPATNLGMASASLSWTNPGGATSWEVEVQPVASGIPPGAGEYIADTNTNWPVPAAGLTSSTAYEYYVRADCGDGNFSAWGGPFFFNTAICESADQCTYTFNMWSENNDTWDQYTMDVIQNGVVVATLAGPDWGMGIAVQSVPLCNGFPLEVFWNNDGTWLDDIGMSITNSFGQVIYTKAPGSGSPDTIIYSLASVDCDTPACVPPTGLGALNATLSTIDLSWDSPVPGEWEYYITAAGEPAPSDAATGTVTGSNFVSGAGPLEAATAYEYYLRMLCDDAPTGHSDWTGPFAFSTSVCAAEEKCNYTFVLMSNGAGWDTGSMTILQGGVTVAQIGPGFTEGTIQEVVVPLCHDMPFDIFWENGGLWSPEIGLQVKNSFGQAFFTLPFDSAGVGTTIYQGTADCITPLCLPPTGLSASNATLTTVDIGWDGPPVGQWEYYIVEAGDSAPQGSDSGIVTVNNPTLGAGELEQSTNYKYYVRLVCPDDGIPGDWAGPLAFSTSVCDVSQKCNYTFIMQSSFWSGWTGGYMTIRQNNTNVAIIGPEFTAGGSMEVVVPLCDSMPFEVFWNSGGLSSGQMALDVVNIFDQTLFSLPFSGSGLGTTIYEGEADCENPECLPPTGLYAQNATMATIDLGWEGEANGTWEYYIVEDGQPGPADTDSGILTLTNPALNVLLPDPATNYEVYVRHFCEDTNEFSHWAGPLDIHSTVCAPESQCTFHFEMTSVNGWGYQGNTMTIYQSGVAVATIGSTFVGGGEEGYSQVVDIPLCPDVPITVLWNIGGFSGQDKGLTIYTPSMEEQFVMDPGTQSQGNTIYTGVPSCVVPLCLKPLNVAVSDILDNSVQVSWTEMGAANLWEIYLIPEGGDSPLANSVGVIADSNPFILTEGIVPGINYDLYVRAICGEDGPSLWTGPVYFQSSFCDPANKCAYTFTMVSSNIWGDGWGTDNLEIIQGGIVVATLHGPQAPNGSTDVTQTLYLCSALPFSVKWNAPGGPWNEDYLGVTIVKEYDGEEVYHLVPGSGDGRPGDVLFTAMPYCSEITCPWPTELTSSGYDFTSAILDWEPAASEAQWDIFIQEEGGSYPGAGTEPTATVNESVYHAYGLEEETVYEYYVRAICADGEVSYWYGPYYFSIFMTDGCAIGITDPGNPDLGTIINGQEYVICQGEELCVELEASYVKTGATTDYVVEEIDYNPPFPLSGGRSLDVKRDDVWSPVVNLPFNFCFYGESYNKCLVGSNGVITFDTTYPSGGCPWIFQSTIPDTGFPVLNAIYGVYQDINPRPGRGEINYQILGNYPCRAFVVNINAVPQFNCGDDNNIGSETSQMVLYEVTNTIEIYIKDRVPCNDWQNGGGVVGIQNSDGTQAVVPDGYNTGNWEAHETAFRFTPNGLPNVAFEWINIVNGEEVQLSTEDLIEFCAEQPSELIARATYSNCDGEEYVKESRILVRQANPIIANQAQDIILCAAGEIPVDLNAAVEGIIEDIENYSVRFYATEAAALAGANDSLDAQYNAVSGTVAIWVRIMRNNEQCFIIDSFNITVNTVIPVSEPQDITWCDSYMLPAIDSGTYYTGIGGTGIQLAAGESITSTQTIYVFSQSNTIPNCTDEHSFVVTIGQKPDFNLGGPYVECNPALTTIAVDAINFNPAEATYVWTVNGQLSDVTTSSITGTAFGAYTVIVTVNGCDTVQSVEMIESTLNVAVEIGDFCEGDNYNIEALNVDGSFDIETATYNWAGPEGFISSDRSFEPAARGAYTVTVTTPEGCVGTAAYNVTSVLCFIQRGISPNGDEKNDFFDLGTMDVSHLSIFNRYGQEVYSRLPYANEWHGQTNSGDELPTGTYFYMIERSNGEQITGWIYINREE